MTRKKHWRPVERERLRVIAWILGPLSAAQQALFEWSRREKAGEKDIGCFIADGAFIVGPQEPHP